MSRDSRVAELKQVLEAKLGEIKRFQANGIKVEGENVEVKSEDAAAYKKLLADCREIRTLIEGFQMADETQRWMEGKSLPEESAAMSAAAALHMAPSLRFKSLGELFTESEEFKALQRSGQVTMPSSWTLETGNLIKAAGGSGLQQKDVYTGLDSHVVDVGIGTRVQFDPLVPRGQRPTRVRDLFPQAATTANLIDYFQVIGFAETGGGEQHGGNAAPVPERDGGNFGLKPKSNLQFRPEQAPVRTIAHWEAAHRNVIQDVPALQSTINNELLYGLALVEDDQLLNGDGTVENIKGILNHSHIQIYTAGANELRSDSLRKATTLAMLANYPPNGYVLHPNDWEQIELQKGSGDGQYMLWTNIAIGLNAQVWRQPVVETPAIAEGTFLNGAFGAAAQVYDRQRASIRIAEQHGDFFVRNAVAILCEERIALAVKRPEAFVKGSFAS